MATSHLNILFILHLCSNIFANLNDNLVENAFIDFIQQRLGSNFNVYWNVPTFQCKSHGILFNDLKEKFGIVQNDDDTFRGDKIAILYDPGFFPALLENSSSGNLFYRNGGIPQKGDLGKHLEIFQNHLAELIPDESFSGLTIIDFESWRPVFRQNFGSLSPYKDVSKSTVRREHPFWPSSWIDSEAMTQFEKYARIFMEETLKLGQKLRPASSWGYYGYPYCFNMNNNNKEPNCPRPVPAENDDTNWLFTLSNTLYPSLYLSENKLTASERQTLIRGRIAEAKRVIRNLWKKPSIVPYFWYKYQDSKDFLTKLDLSQSFSQLKQSNIEGVIIWGSSNDVNTKQKCLNMQNYVYNILGPTVAAILGS